MHGYEGPQNSTVLMVIGDEDHREGATEAGISMLCGSDNPAESDEERARGKLDRLKAKELKEILKDTLDIKFKSNALKDDLKELAWREILLDKSEILFF